jgi:hypothetical protein
MRRIAIILLSCLGLTLALAGPAGAGKAVPLSALTFTSVQSIPNSGDPTVCDVELAWTPAPTAPRGTFFAQYEVASSVVPNAGFDSITPFFQPQGTLQVPSGATSYVKVRALFVKLKGNRQLSYTPVAEATEVPSC